MLCANAVTAARTNLDRGAQLVAAIGLAQEAVDRLQI